MQRAQSVGCVDNQLMKIHAALHRGLRTALEIVWLGGPITVARAGNTLLMVTTVAMVGKAGADQLALQGLGFAVAMTLQQIGLGLLTGTRVSVGLAFGQGDYIECHHAWTRSLPYAFFLGLIGTVVSLGGAPLFSLVGQPGPMAAAAGRITFIVGCSLPAFMLFNTTSYFLEAMGRPVPGMVIIIFGVLLNTLLNWLFIYGHLGMPAAGAEGAAYTTLLVRALLALGLIFYVFWHGRGRSPGGPLPKQKPWRLWSLQRRIGYADGLSLGIESSAFTALTLMAGILGTAHVGAFSIGLSVESVIFTLAVGIASATAVIVSHAAGRGDGYRLREVGWLGLAINMLAVGCASIPLLLWPTEVAKIYSQDSSVIRTAIPLIIISSAALIVDGGQRVMAQILRSCADTWFPSVLHIISYGIVMMPLGWLLAFNAGLGSVGLFLALAIASAFSVLVLSVRFWWLSTARLPRILSHVHTAPDGLA
jgi:multidrug resistance protein, MATE family